MKNARQYRKTIDVLNVDIRYTYIYILYIFMYIYIYSIYIYSIFIYTVYVYTVYIGKKTYGKLVNIPNHNGLKGKSNHGLFTQILSHHPILRLVLL